MSNSPLPNENVNLFSGFNAPMVASCLRDTLRFLFELSAPDRLKYNSEPKDSKIAINLSFDHHPDSDLEKRPNITVNRGGYSSRPVGVTDSMVEGYRDPKTGQLTKKSYLNLIEGQVVLRVTAWEMGVCEELAFLAQTYIMWSRPYITNSLGFKNIAAPIMVSPVAMDRDDKTKFIIEITIPYTTEMAWMDERVGVKIKGFLTDITERG